MPSETVKQRMAKVQGHFRLACRKIGARIHRTTIPRHHGNRETNRSAIGEVPVDRRPAAGGRA